METKTALITGITGQDGSLLAKYLLKHNYRVIAPTRKTPCLTNLTKLNIINNPNIKLINYEKWVDFNSIIGEYKPDELYHLAAMSHVGKSHKYPSRVFDVNVMWTIQILQSVLLNSASTKIFFASSCEIFKNDIDQLVIETDEKMPTNPYGISKLAAHKMIEYYRRVKGLFCSNGILFNHESELRTDDFVSKKICREVARIVKKEGEPLRLGNIKAKKDWGYAPDYVKAFHSMLQLNNPKDIIISTGVLHSVQDMVDSAFSALDFKITWKGNGLDTVAVDKNGETVVAIDERFFRPLDNRFLCGNNHKAQQQLRLNNLTPFKQWVKAMTISEFEKL